MSRRLGLVGELPAEVQEHVRAGAIGSHAAMKYLVPLARANDEDCVRLCNAIAPLGLSTRQVGELYATYMERPRAKVGRSAAHSVKPDR